MRFLYSVIVCGLLIALGSSLLSRHGRKFLILSWALSLGDTALILWRTLAGVRASRAFTSWEVYLSHGIVPTALIFWVMITGALPSHWAFTKKLRLVRTELSLLSCILMLCHILVYLYSFITRSVMPLIISGKPVNTLVMLLSVAGILAAVVMLPLMITSFRNIRARLGGKLWKQIQRWSYVYVALIYAHVFVIYYRKLGRGGWQDLAVYTALFAGYTLLRVSKALSVRKNRQTHEAAPALEA